MKTISLSGIATLLFVLVHTSCTKQLPNQNEDQNFLARIGAGNTNPPQVAPTLKVVYNPTVGVVGQPVTVTGTFDPQAGETVPSCGKIMLEQKVNGVWQAVTSFVDVTASVKEVTYTFTPSQVGDPAYYFRAFYVAANCAGYNNSWSPETPLKVINACNGLSITGVASGIPDSDPGMYQFTVTYTVNTCGVTYDLLKTQGGLTAFSQFLFDATAGYQSWEVGNSTHPNTIIKWEETSALPGNTKSYYAKFKKAYSGTGSVELTGAWSVKASTGGVITDSAYFPPITFQP